MRDFFFLFKLELWLLTRLQWGIKLGWLKLLPSLVVCPSLSSSHSTAKDFLDWQQLLIVTSLQPSIKKEAENWPWSVLVHLLLSTAVVQHYISVITAAKKKVPAWAQQRVWSNNCLNQLSLGDCRSLSVSSNFFTQEVSSVKLSSVIRKIIMPLFNIVIMPLLYETVQSHVQQQERLWKVRHWYYLQWA